VRSGGAGSDAFAAARTLWRRLAIAAPWPPPIRSLPGSNHWFEHVGRPDGVAPLGGGPGSIATGEPCSSFPLLASSARLRIALVLRRQPRELIWRYGEARRQHPITERRCRGCWATWRARAPSILRHRGQHAGNEGRAQPFATRCRGKTSPDDVYAGTFDRKDRKLEPVDERHAPPRRPASHRIDGFRIPAQPRDVDPPS